MPRYARMGVVLSTALTACGGGGTTPVVPVAPTTTTMPAPLVAPALLSPREGQRINQSDPTIGCPFDPVYGTGYVISFSWSAVTESQEGVSYDLHVQHEGAQIPIFDGRVDGTAYRMLSCNAYVAEGNLKNWKWRVRAATSTQIGPWSDERTFEFAPCYVQNHLCGGR
jgi:hypothetical protein